MILVLLVNPQVNNEGEGNKGDDVIRPGDGSANCIAVNKTSVLIGGKVYIAWCMSQEMYHCLSGCGFYRMALFDVYHWLQEEVLRTFASVAGNLTVYGFHQTTENCLLVHQRYPV